MRLIRSKNEGVATFDRRLSTLVSRNSPTGNDVIELPLRTVRMIRIRRFSRRDPKNLNIERMPFHQIGRKRFPSQRLGNLFACAGEFAFRRGPNQLFHVVGIYFAHSSWTKESGVGAFVSNAQALGTNASKIGRASCRERV